MTDHGFDDGRKSKPKRRFSHIGFLDKLSRHKPDEGQAPRRGSHETSDSTSGVTSIGGSEVREAVRKSSIEEEKKAEAHRQRKAEVQREGQKKHRRYSFSGFFNKLTTLHQGGSTSRPVSPPPGPPSPSSDGATASSLSSNSTGQPLKSDSRSRRKSFIVSVAGLIRIDEEDQRGSRPPPPRPVSPPSAMSEVIDTHQHTVSENETMESLAAHCDVTATYLRSINKMMSSWIVPGQTLLLPKRDENTTDDDIEEAEEVGLLYSKAERRRASSAREIHHRNPSSRLQPRPFSRVRHQSILDSSIMSSAVYLKAEHYNYELQKQVAGALLLSSEAAQFESVSAKCGCNESAPGTVTAAGSAAETVTAAGSAAETVTAAGSAAETVTAAGSDAAAAESVAADCIVTAENVTEIASSSDFVHDTSTVAVAAAAAADATAVVAASTAVYTAADDAIKDNVAATPQIYKLEVPLKLLTFVKIFIFSKTLPGPEQPCLYCSTDLQPLNETFTDQESDTFSSHGSHGTSESAEDIDDIIESMLQNITIPDVTSDFSDVMNNATRTYVTPTSDLTSQSQANPRAVECSRCGVGDTLTTSGKSNSDKGDNSTTRTTAAYVDSLDSQRVGINTDSKSSTFFDSTQVDPFETSGRDFPRICKESCLISAASTETLVHSDKSSLDNAPETAGDKLSHILDESIIRNDHSSSVSSVARSTCEVAGEAVCNELCKEDCKLHNRKDINSATDLSYNEDVRSDKVTETTLEQGGAVRDDSLPSQIRTSSCTIAEKAGIDAGSSVIEAQSLQSDVRRTSEGCNTGERDGEYIDIQSSRDTEAEGKCFSDNRVTTEQTSADPRESMNENQNRNKPDEAAILPASINSDSKVSDSINTDGSFSTVSGNSRVDGCVANECSIINPSDSTGQVNISTKTVEKSSDHIIRTTTNANNVVNSSVNTPTDNNYNPNLNTIADNCINTDSSAIDRPDGKCNSNVSDNASFCSDDVTDKTDDVIDSNLKLIDSSATDTTSQRDLDEFKADRLLGDTKSYERSNDQILTERDSFENATSSNLYNKTSSSPQTNDETLGEGSNSSDEILVVENVADSIMNQNKNSLDTAGIGITNPKTAPQKNSSSDLAENTCDSGLSSVKTSIETDKNVDEKLCPTNEGTESNLTEASDESQITAVNDTNEQSFSTTMASLLQRNESHDITDQAIAGQSSGQEERDDDENTEDDEDDDDDDDVTASSCEADDDVEMNFVTDSDAEREYQPLLINGPGTGGRDTENYDKRKFSKDYSQMKAFNYFLCLLTGREPNVRGKSHDDVTVTSRGCGREDCPQKTSTSRQHWFSVPAERIESLYSFFRVYTPAALHTESAPDVTAEEPKGENEILFDYNIELVEASYKSDSDIELTAGDCYMLVKSGKKILHKSRIQHRTRNPRWLEWFSGADLSGSANLTFKLVSYRRGRRHSVIGKASVVPSQLCLNSYTDVDLELTVSDPVSESSVVGWIRIRYILHPSNHNSELIQEHNIPLPELAVDSSIMTAHHVAKISESLPARAQCRTWNLAYSTAVHGFSLTTLYKCMMAYDHSPALLIIRDSQDQVFGAFTSSHLYISQKFYGSGESFLFSFAPEYQKYKWSGSDHHIVKGDLTSLSVGISGSAHGLWLDGDLYRGRSERCQTFENEPLASQLDFTVSSLEVWSFD